MKEEGRAREAAYTVFHPLVVEVLFVLFLTQPAGIVQKQKNTKLLPQADERRCRSERHACCSALDGPSKKDELTF